WKSPSQRGYDENDLPKELEKIALYDAGREKLLASGYVEVGMDHFAKPDDGLAIASQKGTIHRNFMGYTTNHNNTLIGLGVSSIGDAWSSLAQNPIAVEAYLERVEAGEIPLVKGHLHTERDLVIRRAILDLMCGFHCELDMLKDRKERETVIARLSEHLADDLLTVTEDGIEVKPQGRAFIRTIAMALDDFVWNGTSAEQMFSRSV
ncbi:MAG: coproporphyrinogen III oxidase, partial [Flavobacteriales bacterium]|nr:coproporphyrinogen III oxidase [Flavobacteriales bacterium]